MLIALWALNNITAQNNEVMITNTKPANGSTICEYIWYRGSTQEEQTVDLKVMK